MWKHRAKLSLLLVSYLFQNVEKCYFAYLKSVSWCSETKITPQTFLSGKWWPEKDLGHESHSPAETTIVADKPGGRGHFIDCFNCFCFNHVKKWLRIGPCPKMKSLLFDCVTIAYFKSFSFMNVGYKASECWNRFFICICVQIYFCNLPQWCIYSSPEGQFSPQIQRNFLLGAENGAFFLVWKKRS